MVIEQMQKETLKFKSWEEWSTGIMKVAAKASGVTSEHMGEKVIWRWNQEMSKATKEKYLYKR